MDGLRDTGVIRMSETIEIDTDGDGKGNIKIPWKVILIVLGIAGAALGVGEDAFQAILETAGV